MKVSYTAMMRLANYVLCNLSVSKDCNEHAKRLNVISNLQDLQEVHSWEG